MQDASLALPNDAQKNILTIQTTPKLHLSETEYKALDLIAKVYDCTLDEAINVVLHRCIVAELEIAAPESQLKNKLMAENDKVFEAHNTLEQTRKDASEIEVTVTMDLDKNKYDSFRRTYDAISEREFFSNCMDGHLDEMMGRNPELMAEYLEWQNERPYGKK
ncbi:MAG: hypothetical protein ACREAY_01245 [Nitrososphaera sp.]|uniref:hypothetical protein n=1 Tax=Nitrososphaera sp. TaxID=1971748 RepID=UPI003D6F018C